MLIHKFFRLFNDTPGESGSTAVVDRGDLIPEDTDLDPENPDAQAEEIQADPKVQEIEAELEAEADEKKPRKDARIPLDRHEAVLNKERAKSAALAAELSQLKQRGQVSDNATAASADFAAIEADVLKLEDEYANLLTDGEVKKATAVMAKIRQAERHMAEVKADLKVQAATVQIAETTRYNTVLSRIEAAFPVLNPDHDDYSEATMTRVAKMSRMNQADGMTPSAALQDAVDTIIGASTAKQEAATTVTPRVAEKDIAAERKAAAVGKVVKAVGATPPSLSRTGLDSDKLGGGADSAAAVIKMSQKEFAQLSEAALAKLRGDDL